MFSRHNNVNKLAGVTCTCASNHAVYRCLKHWCGEVIKCSVNSVYFISSINRNMLYKCADHTLAEKTILGNHDETVIFWYRYNAMKRTGPWVMQTIEHVVWKVVCRVGVVDNDLSIY